MNQDTVAFAEAADKRAKAVVGISGGLLLLLPGFIGNFKLPHDAFWLIATSAGLSALSLLCATIAFLVADANSRCIALRSETNWPRYHKAYGMATLTFSGAVIAFASFAFINASDFTQPNFKTIDIAFSKPVAVPDETIELKATLDESVKPDSYKWTASVGMLLDDDESSVTWLSPSSVAAGQWVTIGVTVQADGIAITESTRILFIPPSLSKEKINSYLGEPPVVLPFSDYTARPAIYSLEKSQDQASNDAQCNSVRASPSFSCLSSGTGLKLPSRPCCSISTRSYPFCDEKC